MLLVTDGILDLMGITAVERERRLWERLDQTGECWLWTGPKFKSGYGNVKWDSRCRKVHQIVWELLRGDQPSGLEPDHRCRVRACANPDHLEWVTHAENTRRAIMAHGVDNGNGRKTHCPKGHEYTLENTRIWERIDPNTGRSCSRRVCRACHRMSEAARQKCREQGRSTD